MHGTFNGMSLFFLAVISFLCHREAAGVSGLPKDSNTVVGKPQLGEQNCNFLWINIYSKSFSFESARLSFFLFYLFWTKSTRVSRSSFDTPGFGSAG